MSSLRAFVPLASVLLLAATTSTAHADPASRPYATLEDDGTLADDFTKTSTISAVANTVIASYEAAGQKRPDVLSVWTTFPMTGNDLATYYLPLNGDVRGIGFDGLFHGDGTYFDLDASPVRAVLLHNNVRALAERAAKNGSGEEGLAEYLFLLEISHLWGPAARVPGDTPNALLGFDFHWSFWMDAGGSPAGGNVWRDNDDGTFTTAPQRPGTLTFSMLDLYLMGMATPDEVPPFGLLTNVSAVSKSTDPMTKRPLDKASFPWFGDAPVTVRATRVPYTIQDVIAANGVRTPKAADAPKSFTLGIALVVAKGTTPSERAAYETLMDGLAPKLAPAFERATRGRGKLEVLSSVAVVAEPESGDPTPEDPPAAPAPPPTTAASTGGCSTISRAAAASSAGGATLAVLGLGLVARTWRRRRAR